MNLDPIVLREIAKKFSGITEPEVAEFLALREAIILARNNHLTPLIEFEVLNFKYIFSYLFISSS